MYQYNKILQYINYYNSKYYTLNPQFWATIPVTNTSSYITWLVFNAVLYRQGMNFPGIMYLFKKNTSYKIYQMNI